MRCPSPLSFAAVLIAGTLVGALPASGASQKSPAQLLQLSVSAMRSEGSFHYDSTSSFSGVVAITLSTDSSLNDGVQVQKLDGGTETTRLIGKSLYLYANEKAYEADFGVKKTTLANEWVLVPSSNKNYANISSAILIPSVMQQLVDVNDLKEVGAVTVNGQTTLAIRGNAGASGTETVYVSTAAPYLPVAVSAVGTEDGQKVSDELVFSRWGEKFSVATPSKYVIATNATFP
jgi:hypothetical protein